MKLSNDLIIHKLTPFLDLFDRVILLQVSKSISQLRVVILGELDHVVIRNRTMIPHLVSWCPKVKRLEIATKLKSEDIGYLECLPVESLCAVERVDNPQINFPILRHLRVCEFNRLEFPDFRGHLVVNRFTEHILNLQLESLEIEDNVASADVLRLCDKKLPVTSLKMTYFNDEIIERIKILPLRHLSIKQNIGVPDPETLNVEELTISYVTNIRFVGKMPLKKLQINSSASFMPESIKFNNTLESLTMRCVIVYMEDLELPKLKYLELDSCQLRRRTMVTLKLTITQLQCVNMYVEPDIIADTLTKLSFVRCRAPPELIARLPQTITNLRIAGCNIDCNKLQLSNLSILEISGNSGFDVQLSDACLRHIAKNKIVDLTFKFVNITDDNIHHLADMPINYLTLTDCNFSIVGLNQLRGLPLRKLIVSGIPARHLFMSS